MLEDVWLVQAPKYETQHSVPVTSGCAFVRLTAMIAISPIMYA